MRPLRIGFLGNQNNYPFVLARALRRAGHDVRVVVDQQDPLDRPEFRYADVPRPYPSWIREVDEIHPTDVVFETARWRRALDAVRDCDALVLNRLAYDAASRLDRPTFCLTTGADVEHWSCPDAAEAYVRHVERRPRGRGWVAGAFGVEAWTSEARREYLERVPRPLYRAWHKHVFRRFARLQRAGLGRAAAISVFPDEVSPRIGEAMRACLRSGTERLWLLMADAQWIQPVPAPRNPVPRVFNAARILWKPPFPSGIGPWENKGTDILLRGIAQWYRRRRRPIDVRLIEKGPSVAATRQLVSDLGIAHLVSWRAELTQREVFDEYARADIVTEQCGAHILGMAGYEAMAAGRPVIADGRPALMTREIGAAPPVAQAATPDEVAAQLDRLSDPGERERLGRLGRRFVERHLSPDAAAARVAAILGTRLASRPGRIAA